MQFRYFEQDMYVEYVFTHPAGSNIGGTLQLKKRGDKLEAICPFPSCDKKISEYSHPFLREELHAHLKDHERVTGSI